MDFGEDGFGGDEHDRAVGGFAGDDVFGGYGVDVFGDVLAELLFGLFAFAVWGLGVVGFLVVFEGEFSVNGDVAGGLGEEEDAVGAFVVGEGVLE